MQKLTGRASANSSALHLALLVTSLLAGCDCAIDVKQELPSSDGIHKAVLFERDCGATSRNNLQVSVLSGRDLPGEQGNVIALTDTTSRAVLVKDVIQMTWETPTTLRIAYDPMLEVIHKTTGAEGVTIRFTHLGSSESAPAVR